MISKITIGDKQKVDYLVVNEQQMTKEEIEQLFQLTSKPDWDTSGKSPALIANFDHNLVSSYVSGLTSAVSKYQIYRKRIKDSRLYKVCEVDKNTLAIVDYLAANDTEYDWYVYPVTDEAIGFFAQTEKPIKTDFETWSVTFIEPVNEKEKIYFPIETWVFRCNLEIGAFTQNMEKTQFNNYTRFPKFSVGESNYLSGSISCLLGDVDCMNHIYNEPVEKFLRWNELIASGADCIIKDTKGNIFKGQITANQGQQMVHIIDQPPTTISFNFVETDIIDDNIQVYERTKWVEER